MLYFEPYKDINKMKTNPNDPIKAITNLPWNSETNSLAIDEHNTDYILNFLGLTKREYFSAMAMQGLLSGFPNYMPEEAEITPLAVKMADSLIESLNK